MLRLTFRDGTRLLGETEKDVLDAWNALPWWADYDPVEFRERIVDLLAAEIDGGMPAADEEILPALVEADPNIALDKVG